MTEDVAAAIVDWRDEDSDAMTNGAESDYYLSLPEPYYAKNAPFETVDELLWVRGIDRTMLYGDGTAPPLGQPVSNVRSVSSSGTLSTDPQLARGWYDLLTCYSVEGNTAADGQARININNLQNRDQLRQRLQDLLSPSRAQAIMSALGDGRNSRVRDIFDFYFRVHLTPDEFDKVADDLSTSDAKTVKGRIDLNAAPRDVLLCLDGLEDADVDKLIAQRGSMVGSNGQTLIGGDDASGGDGGASIGWVVQALGEKAIGLGDQITTHSSQFSADIVAVSDNGRAYRRVRVVIDTRGDAPQIIYRRDITDRGWPMDEQILASMRAGQGPGNWPVGTFSSGSAPAGTATLGGAAMGGGF
jgi:hypothetical protein